MLKLFETHLSKADNLLSAKNMNIQFVASTHVEKLIKKDAISKTIVANFFENVKVFVTAAQSKMREKSPIGSVAVRNASALDPKVIQV